MIESNGYTEDKVLLYHFAPRQELSVIRGRGLRCSISFQETGSELRQRPIISCVFKSCCQNIYEVRADVLLELSVSPRRCLVADLNLLERSWAYLKDHRRDKARELARQYDATAMPYKMYRQGMMERPEVLVEGDVNAEDIRVVEKILAGKGRL